jgi:hypothetical protein
MSAIRAEADVLWDEGEACARNLSDATARMAGSRSVGITNDFTMLNALAETPAMRVSVG